MKKRELLYDGCEKMGISIAEEQIEKLLEFKDIVLEFNKQMNLTSIKNERDFIIKHLLDSISCLLISEVQDNIKIIDVGTGAGFPSIPLKIMLPSIKLTLIDSQSKKIEFLKEACAELGLTDVEFIHGRAEEYGQNLEYRESYDLVLSRAVAPMNVLTEYCLPFLKVGGNFVCQKGPRLNDELMEAEAAILVLGGNVKYVKSVSLIFDELNHKILVIEKISKSPTKYPRKSGKPTEKPIA